MSHLGGLQCVILGDSLIESGSIATTIATRTSMSVVNGGIGRSRLSGALNDDYASLSFARISAACINAQWSEQIAACDRLAAQGDDNRAILTSIRAIVWPSIEILVAGYGTNDFGNNVPIGAKGDSDYMSLIGGINIGIRSFMFTYPRLRMMLTTPMWRKYNYGDSDEFPNGLGLMLVDYVDAMLETCALNHVPCLDLYRNSCINKHNERYTLADGIHPRLPEGSANVGNMYASALLRNF